MLEWVARWLRRRTGEGAADPEATDADSDPTDADLDLTDPDATYGGDGPTRLYTCPECNGDVAGRDADRQVVCPHCETVFKGVLVPDAAVCPACDSRIDDAAFHPATRRDREYAACGACGYRWESDPR